MSGNVNEQTRADHAAEIVNLTVNNFDDYDDYDSETDPDFEFYLQNEFQDEIVENIFYDIVDYIDHTAALIGGNLNFTRIEELINALLTH